MMTLGNLSLSLLALLTLSLGACSDMSRRDQNTATGAIIGGAAGAVLGGGAAGTVGGAVVGGVIGNKVDPKKK